MAEVFSWPEALIYLFPAGGSSAILTFGQDVRADVTYSWHNNLNIATGTYFARAYDRFMDKDVRLRVGMLFADQSAFWIAHSATAYNARVVLKTTGGYSASAEYQIWSAVFPEWTLIGQDNGIWRSQVVMMAADISGI